MNNAHARVKHRKVMKAREKARKPDCITFVEKYFVNHFKGDSLSPYQRKILESVVAGARFRAWR